MPADSGTHHLGNHAMLRLVIAAMLALALILTLEASPAAVASPETCRVTNTDSGRTYTRLQQAVRAAKPGARLIVKGTCHGGTSINKDITIVGKKTKRTGRPVLDGKDKARVLTIKPKVKVSVRSLVIRNGKATRIPSGGGISNKGRLRLKDVVVRRNEATRGGGIYNEGVLRIRGRSVVSGNGSRNGLYNVGRVVLEGVARIRENCCAEGVYNEGVLVMKDRSAISDNDGWRTGGGVENRGTLTMNDASSISEDSYLGGVRNHDTLTMNDSSSIRDNSAGGGYAAGFGFAGHGGAVHNYGTLAMNGQSSIHGNRAVGWGLIGSEEQYPGRGGGVYNEGSLTMTAPSPASPADPMGPDSPAGVPGHRRRATGPASSPPTVIRTATATG